MNCACGKLPRLNACGGCRQHGMTMKIGCGMRVNTAKHWTHEAHNNGTVKHTHWRRYLEQKYRVQAHGLDAQYVFFLQTIQSSFFLYFWFMLNEQLSIDCNMCACSMQFRFLFAIKSSTHIDKRDYTNTICAFVWYRCRSDLLVERYTV